MPGQRLSQPNPPPEPSLLPDSILNSSVKLDIKNVLTNHELTALQMYRRAALYIAAGVFLFVVLGTLIHPTDVCLQP
jgi:xylulose-5-phosphate/fructose-6-phosphate phosphoketolase